MTGAKIDPPKIVYLSRSRAEAMWVQYALETRVVSDLRVLASKLTDSDLTEAVEKYNDGKLGADTLYRIRG